MSAGLATGALTLITTDLWLLSAEYTGTQLALLGAVAILAVTIALVVGSDLWERPRRHAEREQAVVFNIATLVSVLIGVTVLYIALFLAALAGAVLLVDADVFGQITGDPAHPVHFLKLAWFVGGLATIGSALGAGLEDDDDVRAALFTRASASRRGRPSPMAGEHAGPPGDDVWEPRTAACTAWLSSTEGHAKAMAERQGRQSRTDRTDGGPGCRLGEFSIWT